MANKAIVPSTINATSTVSGTVRAQKHITSGNVNVTSTLSGNVRALKHITSGNISVTSTLSGIGLKPLAGNLNAISTLSGAFVLKPGNILPAQIRATSIIYEVGIIFKTIPAGYYGASDIDDGIII